MGEYDRTEEAIANYKTYLEDMRAELQNPDLTEDEREEILMSIYDCEIYIGELEGYLQELASMDGYSSYDEMVYSCMQYEEVQYGI
jgi:hypothetical protein